ncbi:MAG TPA: LlaJI family restriction endonuclease [Pseudoflavonifractor sp.]|nr:LlaJI family restriction endonuclease [Pseudoflavonifractor sp.]
MISSFIREQKRYTQADLSALLQCTAPETVTLIKKLKEYGVLKTVRATDTQRSLSDLAEEDVEVAEVISGSNDFLYVFPYVGVITIAGRALKCYPKYLTSSAPGRELKQVLKVLEQYSAKEQIIRMFHDTGEDSAFNLLAVMLFLLNDYYENQLYINTQDIIEVDGSGETLWDKVVNETFPLLSSGRPYYPQLFTRRRVNDDFDYFKRLHECVLSLCTKELRSADLLELFDLLPVELSDETLDDFGETDYILYRLQNELNVQFNTRKQILLKTLYAYVAHSRHLDDVGSFSMFGTSSFHAVWETVCAEVLSDQLHTPLGLLKLPVPLNEKYDKDAKLISVIEKPRWVGFSTDGTPFIHEAPETLIPDLISLSTEEGVCRFFILDAKYYTIQLEQGKPLRCQPGVGDLTKQYLYQLAYEEFLREHAIKEVGNCFLMPTERADIEVLGLAVMPMLTALGLRSIQIRLLPAAMMYDLYLNHKTLSIGALSLETAPTDTDGL